MAAQHLPRDPVWPSSGLKELAQMTQKKLQYHADETINVGT